MTRATISARASRTQETPQGSVLSATDATLEELVTGTEQPVLVDFWATWCGPCKAVAPILDELAGELAGQARILKLDVDRNPKSAARFGVRSIPTMILFKQGEVADVLIGAQTKPKLERLLRKASKPRGGGLLGLFRK